MKRGVGFLFLLLWGSLLCVACRPKTETIEVTRVVTETIIETVEVTPTINSVSESGPENDLGEVAEETVASVTATPRPTETISLAPGTDFTRVVGALPSHSEQSYRLTAQQGQEIEVVVVSPPIEGVTLAVFLSDGTPLQPSDAGNLSYRGTLAQSGDIILTVVSRDNPVPYGLDVTLVTPTQVVEQVPGGIGGAPTVLPGSEPVDSAASGGESVSANQETSDVVNWGTYKGAPTETFFYTGGGDGGPFLVESSELCSAPDSEGKVFAFIENDKYFGRGQYSVNALACHVNPDDLSVTITTPDQRIIRNEELTTLSDSSNSYVQKVYDIDRGEIMGNDPFRVTFTTFYSTAIELETRLYKSPTVTSITEDNVSIELWAFDPNEIVRILFFDVISPHDSGKPTWEWPQEMIGWKEVIVSNSGYIKIELPFEASQFGDFAIGAHRASGELVEEIFSPNLNADVVHSSQRLPPYLSSLRVTAATPTTVSLTWDAWDAGSDSLENYRWEVLRREAPGGPHEVVGLIESPDFEDSTITAGMSYYYVVRTVDAAGNVLANSRELMVTVPAEGVLAPNAPNIEPTEEVFTPSSPNAVTFRVRIPENLIGRVGSHCR